MADGRPGGKAPQSTNPRAQARQARRAVALRENLRKRKEQARARAAKATPSPRRAND